MKIVIKRGLDIPLAGGPSGAPRHLSSPSVIALNLEAFAIRFTLLVKEGAHVRIGQPLVENRAIPGQYFVSPAGGVVTAICRNAERRVTALLIAVDSEEAYEEFGSHSQAFREELLALFMRSGMAPHIRVRPFHQIFHPNQMPRAIFVRAVESLPFVPSAEQQLAGWESYAVAGLKALKKLTSGPVHLVYHAKSRAPFFRDIQGIEKHTIRGPHPAGTTSVLIHHISPIQQAEECVWHLSLVDLLTVGKMVREGRYFTERIISRAGEGVKAEARGFFYGRMGLSLASFTQDCLVPGPVRLISGDPLTGSQATDDAFLGFYHTSVTAIPEGTKRRWFSFLRPSLHKYTATHTDSSHLKAAPQGGWSFTTSQNGERRPFIDGAIYEKVMPMRIPTMPLLKALLCEDFELAETLGLLEVVEEDFALAAFLCPSKIEMVSLVKEGLHRYLATMGS